MSPHEKSRGHGAASTAAEKLEALRAELDRIDGVLLDGLRERLAFCAEIGRVKREHGMPVEQPRRAAAVHERAARFAAEHGVDVRYVRRIYALIIAESCGLQDRIARSSCGRPAS